MYGYLKKPLYKLVDKVEELRQEFWKMEDRYTRIFILILVVYFIGWVIWLVIRDNGS